MGLGSLESGFCCLNVALDVSSKIIAIISIIFGIIGFILAIVLGAWLSIIGAILGISAGGLLFYGAHVRRPNFALFYLILTFINIIWYFILVILFFIAGGIAGGIIYMLIMGIVSYFWYVVFSFYNHMKA